MFETVAWKGVFVGADGEAQDVEFIPDPENAAKATFVMPAGDVTVSASFTLKPIHYIDEKGRDRVCEEYVPMSSLEDVEGLTLDNIWPELQNLETDKWYVVDKDLTFENRVHINSYDNCPVYIILCDGVTLTAKKGIGNNRDNCLIICGQSEGTGTLKCFTGSEPGSVVPAPLGGDENQDGGHLIICGGNVYATSNGHAPAIGCSYATVPQSQSKNGGTVRISGGYVEARTNGAYNAIGALTDESISLNDVIITGGTVIAYTLSTMTDRAAINTDGGVTIGDDMMVTAGYNDDDTAVLRESSERVTACKTNRYAKIEVCPHQAPSFEISKAGHIIHCANCTVGGGGIMPHTFEDDRCTICGYHGFTVTFLPGEGTGSMIRSSRIPASPYRCPMPTSSPPLSTRYSRSGPWRSVTKNP